MNKQCSFFTLMYPLSDFVKGIVCTLMEIATKLYSGRISSKPWRGTP